MFDCKGLSEVVRWIRPTLRETTMKESATSFLPQSVHRICGHRREYSLRTRLEPCPCFGLWRPLTLTVLLNALDVRQRDGQCDIVRARLTVCDIRLSQVEEPLSNAGLIHGYL